MEFAKPGETIKAIKKFPLGKILRPALILLVTFGATLIAIIFTGSFINAGIKIQNAPITLVHVLLAYLLASQHQFTRRQTINFIALALFLSWTSGLMQGSILLVILPWLLKKLRLI